MVISMSEPVSLYEWSRADAIRSGEENLWKESYKANCDCARTIEKAIRDNYWDNSLHTDFAQSIIRAYGFNRVNFVLANTIQQKLDDGRFSRENRGWAQKIYIPKDDVRWHFAVDSHPGLTDIFASRVQQEYKALNLLEADSCVPNASQEDYSGKVLVLRGEVLKDQFKRPEEQLFLASSGFGCRPNAVGTKVYGEFLSDGEQTHFHRSDFLGPIREECLPDWARERLEEISAETEEVQSMGGM